MSRERRDIQGFNLSFLDVVCCGFGAIILLLVLTKSSELVVLEETRQDMDAMVADLQLRIERIRGEARVLNRELTAVREQQSEERDRVARLKRDLNQAQGRYASASSDAEVQTTIAGKLDSARQTLTEEMRRLQALAQRRPKVDAPVGGIPVDSEYIIFIIDTSGSMQDFAWGLVVRKVEETLDIYPRVKGIQVMNDMGVYMFSSYTARWIPDTPARRRAIVSRLRSWRPFSNSSPVEGIEAAIRTFYAPDRKISLYVFGDEFAGGSIQAVIDEVDRLNRPGGGGERLVRIHGVGFPTQFNRPYRLQTTGIRFAALMRELSRRNGGTFVGLNSARP
jgi:hypothetical protein